MPDTQAIGFVVDDEAVEVDLPPTTPLVEVLRDELGKSGVRTGCGIGECGSCTVVSDGAAIRSCTTLLEQVAGSAVTTPDGLGSAEAPNQVRQAFLDEQAAQCGYCINGMIMTVAAHWRPDGGSDRDAIRAALDEHLCRCGSYARIARAVDRLVDGPLRVPAVEVLPEPDPMAGAPDTPRALTEDPRIERWIRLERDGRIAILPGKVELGQGIVTVLRQIAVAQLGVAAEIVRVVPTVTGVSPDESVTSGSRSVESGGLAIGCAAVAFRRLLLDRAADLLGTTPGELVIDDAAIRTSDADQTVSLTDLAASGPIEGRIEDSDQPRWDLDPIGLPWPRSDLPYKLDAHAAYVQDVTADGLLFARALLPPNPGATPAGLDVGLIRDHPGVVSVVQDDRVVVVVAERDAASKAAIGRAARTLRWEGSALDGVGSRLEDHLRALPSEPLVVCDDDWPVAQQPGNHHRASYFRPYQAHGPVAPSAAVARLDEDSLRIWTHSQSPYPLRRELASLLDRGEDDIVIEHVAGPGCYGMDGADDAAAFAAIAACSVPGRTVRFAFTMEDEFAWDPTGPAAICDLDAVLDEEGRISAWRHRTISDSHGVRPNGAGDALMPAWLGAECRERPWKGPGEPAARNAVPPYDIPRLHVQADHVRGPLRTGPLRSLGAYGNVFAAESFMDELAERAGRDPVKFRLEHLRDPRARRVVEVAAQRSGWVEHIGPSGAGKGLAFARYKSTKAYAAVVADVEVDTESGQVAVRRLVVVADAGTVVNPDGLANQFEGGALQGLSRALHEELTVGPDGIVERGWDRYRSLRLHEVPAVEVTLLDPRGAPPLGAGEASTPPVPAAVANAIDDAIGVRVRRLPLSAARLQRRLLELNDEEMQRVRL